MKKCLLIVLTLCLLAGAGLSEARYIDHGNGTVTDTQTGLMWQQATAPNRMAWNDAIAWCNNLSLAGYSDWRLPDIDELRSLINTNYRPTIHPDFFPDTQSSGYWSSGTVTNYTNSSRGSSISAMATSTTTVRQIAIMCVRCVWDSLGHLVL